MKCSLLSRVWLFCNPMDCSLPGSSVHGIFQARILEWDAISFSRGSSQPRVWTRVSHIAGRCFNLWTTREALPYLSVHIFVLCVCVSIPANKLICTVSLESTYMCLIYNACFSLSDSVWQSLGPWTSFFNGYQWASPSVKRVWSRLQEMCAQLAPWSRAQEGEWHVRPLCVYAPHPRVPWLPPGILHSQACLKPDVLPCV